MNYGYHSPSLELKLNEEDEIERYPIQLYSFIANQAEIIDKNILEFTISQILILSLGMQKISLLSIIHMIF